MDLIVFMPGKRNTKNYFNNDKNKGMDQKIS